MAETKYPSCKKCHRPANPCGIRNCPHPAINKAYGEMICHYCCRKCKYHITYPLNGMVGCGYVAENGTEE